MIMHYKKHMFLEEDQEMLTLAALLLRRGPPQPLGSDNTNSVHFSFRVNSGTGRKEVVGDILEPAHD